MKKIIISILLVMLSLTFIPKAKATNLYDLSYYNLRDHYTIRTSNQLEFSNCFMHASKTSLETCININTSEHISISPSYTALLQKKLSPSLTIGANGGSMYDYYYYLKDNGVVSEFDFNSLNLLYSNNENYLDYLNVLTKVSDKSLMDNIDIVTLNYNKDEIKRHITSNGSVNLNLSNVDVKSNGKFYYAEKSNQASFHAVSIIGWDDFIEITLNNTLYKGAYICLNSYGNNKENNGIFYYFYDYIPNYNKIYGFKYKGTPDLTFTSSNEIAPNQKSITLRYFEPITSLKIQATSKSNELIDLDYNYSKNEITIDLDNIYKGVVKLKLEVNGKEYVKYLEYKHNLNIDYASFLNNKEYQYNKFDINSNNEEINLRTTTSNAILLLVPSYDFKYSNITLTPLDTVAQTRIDTYDIKSSKIYIYFSSLQDGINRFRLDLECDGSSISYFINVGMGEYKIVNVCFDNDINPYFKDYIIKDMLEVENKNFKYYISLNNSIISDIRHNPSYNGHTKRNNITDYHYDSIITQNYEVNEIDYFKESNIKSSIKAFTDNQNKFTDVDLRVGGVLDPLAYNSKNGYGIIILHHSQTPISQRVTSIEKLNELLQTKYALRCNPVKVDSGYQFAWVISNITKKDYNTTLDCCFYMIKDNTLYLSKQSEITMTQTINKYITLIESGYPEMEVYYEELKKLIS